MKTYRGKNSESCHPDHHAEVSRLYDVISDTFPDQDVELVQEVAIDLHDIEHECLRITSIVADLRTTPSPDTEHVYHQLINITYGLVDHLLKSHIPTLSSFIEGLSDEKNTGTPVK